MLDTEYHLPSIKPDNPVERLLSALEIDPERARTIKGCVFIDMVYVGQFVDLASKTPLQFRLILAAATHIDADIERDLRRSSTLSLKA